ncbi:hypothetical protein RclHR1_15470005 [Rhizophagus clarus]|uniref:Uncharacterized protein n=1 Tax=Rhizophagus clarus TaxID=94130 RepID=A0A2Z6QFD1_9GLOM|nr:hypothetical protein RclHR1_15470005 [Rhizophagus clarus]GES78566.1 hypothetical protein GLOIN_2v1847125 [Rhizophagus clarus]
MVVRVMQLFALLLSFAVLAAVFLSFSFVKLPDMKQQPDRHTGYPTWHGEVEGYNSDQNDAVNTLTVVFLAVTGAIGLKIVNNPPTSQKLITRFYTISDDSDENIVGVPTIGFDRLLIVYVWATLATVLFAILVDVGKLFSVVGIFHNSTEFAILTLIGNGGRIKGGSLFAWLTFYILSSSAAVILLEFPKDAAFFKFQGLIMDIALVIEFTRIYISTKEHIREAERDTLPPLNADEDDNNVTTHNTYLPTLPTTIEYPKHLTILLLASYLHLAGNILNILFFSKNFPLLIFELSYSTVFPIYVYFVYLDVTATSILPKRIYLPYTPTWKAILIAINSITLSLFIFRLSFLFSNRSD